MVEYPDAHSWEGMFWDSVQAPEISPVVAVEVIGPSASDWSAALSACAVRWQDVRRWRYALSQKPEPAPDDKGDVCGACVHAKKDSREEPCKSCSEHETFGAFVSALATKPQAPYPHPEHGAPWPWNCAIPPATLPDRLVQIKVAEANDWSTAMHPGEVYWLNVVRWRYAPLQAPTTPAPSGGGKLTGNHYYRVTVIEPIAPDVLPYVAECADIIEALGMTFNEGEAFKAIWGLAAARQGRVKATGSGPKYDADKVAHYGARIAAQNKNV